MEEGDSFSCLCSSGFTGTDCSVNINECQGNPCQNEGACVDLTGGFTCFCAPGFTGSTCDSEINFCSNDSCSPNGVCNSLSNGFECLCDAGFTGDMCDIDIDECDSNPCLNGGSCIDGIGSFMCLCEPGFTGQFCNIDINECETLTLPCLNGGLCQNQFGGFSCICPSGFSGVTCDVQTDFCIDQVCFNGGTCNSGDNIFSCSCPFGWSGDRCQFADNVVSKLDSCGFTMARDMLADAGLVDSSEALSIIGGSPSVSFQYSLEGSSGFYFSGWIWQQDGTNSVLFSFSDDSQSRAGQLVSDLTNREIQFYFSTATGQLISTTFTEASINPNTWMHVALAVFNNNSVFINIDGTYSQSSVLQADSEGVEIIDDIFDLPSSIILNIGRGITLLPSAQTFSGLMRGVAINGIIASSVSFDLDGLQTCLLNCIGTESFCSSNGICLDLFGPDRRCNCSNDGITGLKCQLTHDRFSFDGSGFAQFFDPSRSLESLQFSFKTDQSPGQVYLHNTTSVQAQFELVDNNSISIELSYCDGNVTDQSLVSPASTLNDLQYHTVTVSDDTIQLDTNSPEGFPLASPSCSNTFTPSVIFGSFGADQDNNFQGCMKDVSYNGAQLDLNFLRLSRGSSFGCTRDTAQFFTLSHLELPQFISRESQVISLEISTLATSGIIYFSRRIPGDATGNMPNDFVAIHMEDGRVIFTLNLGEQSQNVILQSNLQVNDSEWHRVMAVQNGTLASLYVDGILMQAESMGPLVLLDTTGNVFLGGVPSESRIGGFNNYIGFDGCVRDLEQNDVAADMQSHVSTSNVRFGSCN